MHVRMHRLWPRRRGDGSLPLGLSCDDEGLLIAGNCRLVEAALDREGHRFYRPRSGNEVSALLSAGYGIAIDASDLAPALAPIWMICERTRSFGRSAASTLSKHTMGQPGTDMNGITSWSRALTSHPSS